MKAVHEKRLLNRIIFHNVRIIVSFVLLIWIFVTAFFCYTSYQTKTLQYEDILEQYATDVKEEINRAILHTEHIAKSSYISDGLQKKSFTMVEALEFFDHTTEILSLPSEDSNEMLIYHTNESLYESRFFRHAHRLPEYEKVMANFKTSSNAILFGKSISHAKKGEGGLTITMYRRIPRQSDNLLTYPVTFPDNINDFPVTIVHSTALVPNMGDYYQEKINEEFICLLPIPKTVIFLQILKVFGLCTLLLLLIIFTIVAIAKRTARQTLREINDFIETLNDESLLMGDNFFHTTYDLYELNVIQKTLVKLIHAVKDSTMQLQSAELEKKQLEMDLLAMQLDPHMLYNSLASIRLDAYLEKNNKILNLVDNMAMYYRSLLNKKQKMIPLENELETIRKYIYINELSQNTTYLFETEIEDSLKQFLIPPQLLHTFVENTVLHGLSGLNRQGIIRIKATEEKGIITIELYDNGYGITEEKLRMLNERIPMKGHMGVDNSIRRMKLVYGEDSHVHFESKKNEYTRVTIRFSKPETPEEASF